MVKCFQILQTLSENFNAELLHGGNVNIKILSDERKKAYLNGSEIREITLIINAFSADEVTALTALSDFRSEIKRLGFVIDITFFEITGKYKITGEYSYEQKIKVKYFSKEDY